MQVLVVVLIDVAVVGHQRMGPLELIGGFLADAVSLPRVALDSYVGVESAPIVDDLEYMRVSHANKISDSFTQ